MAVTRGDRPPFEPEDGAPEALRSLVAAMWSQEPEARPSALDVLSALQSDDIAKDLCYIAFKQDEQNRGLLAPAGGSRDRLNT